MPGTDKTIKVSVDANLESFRRVKGLVDDLKRSFDQLAASMAKSMGGGFSTKAGIPGVAGSTPGRASFAGGQMNVPGRGGGAGGIIGQALGVGDAQSIRTLVSATDQAFNRVGSNVRTMVDRATADLGRLRSAIATLPGTGPAGSGGGSVVGAAGGTINPAAPGGTPTPPPPPAPTKPSQAPRGPSVAQGLLGVVQQGAGSVGLGFGGRLLGAIGGGLGAGALVGGIGAAAIGGLNYLANARQSNLITNLQYEAGQALGTQSSLAASAQPFYSMYAARRGHDWGAQMATVKALSRDSAMRGLLAQDKVLEANLRAAGKKGATVEHLTGEIAAAAGGLGSSGPGGGITIDSFGQARTSDGALYSPGIHDRGSIISGLDKTAAASRRNANDIAREQAERGVSAEQAAKLQDLISANRATGGRLFDVASEVGAGSLGQLQARRAGGMGPPKGVDPAIWYRDLEARLTTRGYTTGDAFSGNRSIISTLGVGYSGRVDPLASQSMAYGGAPGAESIARAAGIAGGSVSAGAAIFRGQNILGTVGRGALDPLAGAELASASFGRAQANLSQFGQGGDGASAFARASAGLVYGGGQDVAAQMGASQSLGRGLDQLGGLSSGKTAPLYEAAGVISTSRIAGGYGYLSEGLMGLDPSALIGLARGEGKIPASLAYQAGPGDDVRKMAQQRLQDLRRAPFYESVGSMVKAGSPAESLLNEVRGAGGDYVSVFESKLKGLEGGARGAKLRELNEGLGGLAVGGADALLAGEATSPILAPFLEGKGAAGAGPKGSERVALEEQASEKRADRDVLKGGGLEKVLDAVKAFGKLAPQAEALVGTMDRLQGLANLPSAKEMAAFRDAVIGVGSAYRKYFGGARVPGG